MALGVTLTGAAAPPPGTGGTWTTAITASVSASVVSPQDLFLDPLNPWPLNLSLLAVDAAGASIFLQISLSSRTLC